MSHPSTGDRASEGDFLGDLPDGVGCAEIWERLSERRDEG